MLCVLGDRGCDFFFFFFKTNLYSGIQAIDQDRSRHTLDDSVGNPPNPLPPPTPGTKQLHSYLHSVPDLTKHSPALRHTPTGSHPRVYFTGEEGRVGEAVGVCSSRGRFGHGRSPRKKGAS